MPLAMKTVGLKWSGAEMTNSNGVVEAFAFLVANDPWLQLVIGDSWC
jgi:hypothetical protein